MRRTTVIASAIALLLLCRAPALAQLDKSEVKCRTKIAGNVTKLVGAGLKTLAGYTKKRDGGKIAFDADVFALTNADAKLAATEAKLKAQIVDACAGLDDDVRHLYVSCPTPCRGGAGIHNPLASYAEVAECLACGARAFVTAEGRSKLGSPTVSAMTSDDRRCHGAIAKAVTAYDVAILKEQTKCQAAADKLGTNSLAGCTLPNDPKGAIEKAATKGDAALAKACAEADLTRVGSCSTLSLPALQLCVGMPRAGFGGGPTLFESLYGLAPSRGAVRGSVVLALATQEGRTIPLPDVTLSLALGGGSGTPPVATVATDVRGTFAFPPVPLGAYQLCWNAPGYTGSCRADPVVVDAEAVILSEPVAVAPVVDPTVGVVRGRVLMADGTPCPLDDPFLGASQSATVSVVANDGTGTVLGEAQTNGSGDFLVTGIPPGSVTVQAACAGALVTAASPPPDPSGFTRLDLTWPNHGPVTTDLVVTKGGVPAGVVQPGDTVDVSALVHDDDGNPLDYVWRSDDAAGVVTVNGSAATWTVPPREGVHELYLSAHDALGGFDMTKLAVGCNQLPYIINAKAWAQQATVPAWDQYPTSIFLTRKGVGSAAEACTYYNIVDPACADLDCNGTPDPSIFSMPCKRSTLGGWWDVNGFNPLNGSGGDVTRTFYENHNDLGFGREMNCRKAPSGNVACFVANYGQGNQDPGNANLAYAANPNCAVATVAMEYSPVEGFEGVGPLVKFFVYKGRGPGSPRLGSADLDGFGQKFVPNLCLNCHGGSSNLAGEVLIPFEFGPGMYGWVQILAALLQRYALLLNITADPSSFLPFDLPTLRYPTAAPQSTQEAAFKTQNLHVKDTNPRTGIVDLVNGWYAGNSPTQITSFIPLAWTGSTPAIDLYTKVVAPACRTCHTAHPLDFLTYAPIMQTSSFSNVCGSFKAMPHAYVTYKNFWLGGTGPAHLASLAQTGNACQ